MKSAREIAHELANSYDASCLDHEVLGWSHGPRCNDITDAITRDRAARPVDVRAGMERAAVLADAMATTWRRDKTVADVCRALHDMFLALAAPEPAAPTCDGSPGKPGMIEAQMGHGTPTINGWLTRCPGCPRCAPVGTP